MNDLITQRTADNFAIEFKFYSNEDPLSRKNFDELTNSIIKIHPFSYYTEKKYNILSFDFIEDINGKCVEQIQCLPKNRFHSFEIQLTLFDPYDEPCETITFLECSLSELILGPLYLGYGEKLISHAHIEYTKCVRKNKI